MNDRTNSRYGMTNRSVDSCDSTYIAW